MVDRRPWAHRQGPTKHRHPTDLVLIDRIDLMTNNPIMLNFIVNIALGLNFIVNIALGLYFIVNIALGSSKEVDNKHFAYVIQEMC